MSRIWAGIHWGFDLAAGRPLWLHIDAAVPGLIPEAIIVAG